MFDTFFSTLYLGEFAVIQIMIPNKFMLDTKWSVTKWVATKSGDVTVLFNVENEESLSWLEKAYGIGKTREEAIRNLRKKLPNGNGNW